MILLCKPEIRRALLANGAKDSGELLIHPHRKINYLENSIRAKEQI
jgi:hypothetical protein